LGGVGARRSGFVGVAGTGQDPPPAQRQVLTGDPSGSGPDVVVVLVVGGLVGGGLVGPPVELVVLVEVVVGEVLVLVGDDRGTRGGGPGRAGRSGAGPAGSGGFLGLARQGRHGVATAA